MPRGVCQINIYSNQHINFQVPWAAFAHKKKADTVPVIRVSDRAASDQEKALFNFVPLFHFLRKNSGTKLTTGVDFLSQLVEHMPWGCCTPSPGISSALSLKNKPAMQDGHQGKPTTNRIRIQHKMLKCTFYTATPVH